ncbi:MAG: glycoside hydrolase family 1 protein [Polyangiales bacterium]
MRRAAGFASLMVSALVACSSKDSAPAATDAGTDTSASCGVATSVEHYVRSPGTETVFPPKFLFGAASAGMQIEKGLVHADWYQWAKVPGKVANHDQPDDGPDGLAHIADDVAGLKAAGLGGYRFSIEWSRIFPTKESFDSKTPDADAVAKYHELLKALKDAGIRPMVTLHHFATPDYLDDITKPKEPQSFERPEMEASFAAWCAWAGKEFGAEVDDWVTINEPLVLMVGTYLGGAHPPGPTLDIDRMFAATKKLVRTHVAAYKALHEADTVDAGTGHAAWVSIAKHNRVFVPYDSCEDTDVTAAKQTDYVWNQWMYNALVLGDWDDDLDGNYDGPNDKKGDPTLKGSVDWLGLNYYGVSTVSGKVKLKYIGGIPDYAGLATDLPKTDMNWDIYPQGFRKVIGQLKKYNLPVIITENGVGDSADVNKSRYLAEHLWEVGWAIVDDGVDVQGYFFWSLTDNFEWDHGFCPRFGLFRIDYSTAARTRTATKAVATYKQIADAKKLTTATIDALPAYATPTLCPAAK